MCVTVVCRSVLQCVAVCCSVLRCVAVTPSGTVDVDVLNCSVLQFFNMLQCVAVCCSDVIKDSRRRCV